MTASIRSAYLLAALTLIPLLGCARGGKPEVEAEEQKPTYRGLDVSLVVQVEPAALQLQQGGKGKLKISVTRRAVQGSITLEARNLPADVTAPKVTIPAGQTTAEMELTASPTAASSERTDTVIAATASMGIQVISQPVRVSVQGAPFRLTTSLAMLKVSQGTRAKLTVTAQRKGYKGPIAVELANPPPGLEPIKGTIPEGKDSVELEVAVNPRIPLGDRPNVHVIGFARAGGATYRDITPGITLSVQPPPFSLRVEQATLRLGQGGKALLKIHADRKGYQGAIDVQISNLPAGVTMPKFTIAPHLRSDDIPLTATVQAPLGDKAGLQVVGSASGESTYQATSPTFTLSIHPGLQLQAAPQAVKISQGGKAQLSITPVRTGYTGLIHVELVGLPAGVTAPRTSIPSFKNTQEIELTADGDAVPQASGKVQVVARVPEGNHQLAATEVKVVVAAALRVVPVPFTLRVEPSTVKLAPASKARIKVEALRKEYQGPITLEVRNLPAHVTAAKATIAEKQNSVDVEVTAAGNASGEKTDVNVLGTGQGQEIGVSPNFAVGVQVRPFELRAQPGTLRLTPGSSAMLKVQAIRKSYQGPIALELRDLPTGVRATKSVLPAGQIEGQIEVSAEETAIPVVKPDAHVVGTADRDQIASSPITINVGAGLFELRVEPEGVKLKHGVTAKVKVIAKRKGNQSPIAVTLRNLPMGVTASRATIAKDRDSAEIEVTAGSDAPEGDTVDVHAAGGVDVFGKQVTSPCITVGIISVGQAQFELKVEPIVVRLDQRSTVRLKVTVVRTKTYDGPITLSVRNLPEGVNAAKVTVPMRQTTAEIELTAAVFAGTDSRSDVCVVGMASGGAKQAVASPHLTVTVGKK